MGRVYVIQWLWNFFMKYFREKGYRQEAQEI